MNLWVVFTAFIFVQIYATIFCYFYRSKIWYLYEFNNKDTWIRHTHMYAIHGKWQHHIYTPTFYYAKLMVYRQPCVNWSWFYIARTNNNGLRKCTAVHTSSFIMFHNNVCTFQYFTQKRRFYRERLIPPSDISTISFSRSIKSSNSKLSLGSNFVCL